MAASRVAAASSGLRISARSGVTSVSNPFGQRLGGQGGGIHPVRRRDHRLERLGQHELQEGARQLRLVEAFQDAATSICM
jgi:hypothetical protein